LRRRVALFLLRLYRVAGGDKRRCANGAFLAPARHAARYSYPYLCAPLPAFHLKLSASTGGGFACGGRLRGNNCGNEGHGLTTSPATRVRVIRYILLHFSTCGRSILSPVLATTSTRAPSQTSAYDADISIPAPACVAIWRNSRMLVRAGALRQRACHIAASHRTRSWHCKTSRSRRANADTRGGKRRRTLAATALGGS